MDPILYYGLVLGILTVVAFVLRVLRVDPIFIWTFVFHGAVYTTASVWEFCLTYPALKLGLDWLYLFGLWWVMMGVLTISYFAFYLIYQYHFSQRIVWDKTFAIGILLAGGVLLFGVLEDFGVFVIWGIEHLNPIDAPWHYFVPWLPFPPFYLLAIVGIVLCAIGLGWSTLSRSVKRILPPVLKKNCTGDLSWCSSTSEFLGRSYRLCTTKNGSLCIDVNE